MTRSASSTALRRLLALCLTLAALSPASASAQSAPSFGGFSAAVETAALSMVVYEPAVQLAVTSSLAAADLGLARTHLSTGPNGKALASLGWPGDFVAGAPGLVAEDAPAYPGAAQAQFPQGPTEHAGPEAPGIVATHAEAKDYLAVADARVGPDVEGAISVASAEGHGRSTVEDGVVLAQGAASLTAVDLLAGLVTVEDIRATAVARSDGATASSESTTVVSGLQIGGQGFIADAGGVRPVGGDQAAGMPEGDEMLKQIGLTVEYTAPEESVDGARAERVGQVLRITVDTVLLREAMMQLPLAQAIEATPGEVAAQLYPVLNLGPKVVFQLGGIRVSAVATEEYSAGDIAGGIGGAATDDSSFFGAGSAAPMPFAGDTGVWTDTGTAGTPAPSFAGSAGGGVVGAVPLTSTGAGALPEAFRGIPGALLGLALLLSLSAARRLRGLTAAVLAGGGAVASRCTGAATGGIPDLRATRG